MLFSVLILDWFNVIPFLLFCSQMYKTTKRVAGKLRTILYMSPFFPNNIIWSGV